MMKGSGRDQEQTSQKPGNMKSGLGSTTWKLQVMLNLLDWGQRRKLPWQQRVCTDQGWPTAGTYNSTCSLAQCYNNWLLTHISVQCYWWVWALPYGVVQGVSFCPALDSSLSNMPPAKSVSRVDREPVGSQGQSGEELGLEWEFLVPRPVAGISTTLSCLSVCLILFTLLSCGNHTACSAHPQHRDFKRQYIFF